jgi:hypothetical protein
MTCSSLPVSATYWKDSLINGQPAKIRCVDIDKQTYVVNGGPVTVAGLEDDWYEDVRDPESVIKALSTQPGFKPDVFTFLQRMPDLQPRYDFHLEFEAVAALPITSYDQWWNKQVKGTTRNMVRKSQKAGVETKEVPYDDEFVRGMVQIFNESPMRQGRRFWHYGKDFGTVKEQFSRYIFREEMIGAYYKGELIGFVMLGDAERFGVVGQIISMIKHRDKATNNALMAKAVEVCARKKLPYLVYGYWSESSLVDFKRYSGFEEARMPRYFVGLTQKGKLGLKLGLHRGWKAIVPEKIKVPLKKLRRHWHELHAKRHHVDNQRAT